MDRRNNDIHLPNLYNYVNFLDSLLSLIRVEGRRRLYVWEDAMDYDVGDLPGNPI